VVDTFGGELPESIEHIAVNDAGVRKRAFRLFELDGSRATPTSNAPWHFLAPALATSMIGEAVERVVFARDEGANLAWAIEQYVEGPLGRPLDRGREWFAGAGIDADTAPAAGNDKDSWLYRLHAGVTPAWWVPLVPRRAEGTEQIRLRRGRMRQWEELDESVGPIGELLQPGRPFFIEESEVPKSGTQVDRRWQYARWVDGSTHLWQQRGKRPVRSVPSSGLRWDDLGPAV